MTQIKHKTTGEILCDGKSLDEVLELHKKWLNNEKGGLRAILKDANLSDANLSFAYLSDADLRHANLNDADLSFADLRHAYLSDANLRNANLSYANLSDANLMRAKMDYQIQDGLLAQIAEIVLKDETKLDMSGWHPCETTHCIAGWACHLDKTAKSLESTHGTEIAGLLTLGAEAHSYFFKSNEEALEYLKKIK